MPEWLTTGQVADYLQVSVSTVYRWVAEGRLPAYKIGNTRRFRRDEVDALAVPIVPEVRDEEGSGHD